MLANKLNYGDTIGIVGVSNSLKYDDKYDLFYRAEQHFQIKISSNQEVKIIEPFIKLLYTFFKIENILI